MAGYGTDETFATWLSENGYEVPEGAPTAAVLRQRGSQYVDGLYGMRFVGEKAGGWAQERAWPRKGAYVGSSLIPDTEIPLPVVYASYEAALQEARDPESLSLIGSAAERVKREKVDGAVEVEYQQAGSDEFAASITPVMTAIEGLLAPFLRSVGGFPAIMVV
ncbi:DnaT-like ssDNA-binding protein [Aquamicrobium soli]|uniref:DnaT-like ssDNA-binding protein n=1 Tax=Aquamicrobium soli TaxID=1811518 RepID=A0ABV7KGL6_9HYPH